MSPDAPAGAAGSSALVTNPDPTSAAASAGWAAVEGMSVAPLWARGAARADLRRVPLSLLSLISFLRRQLRPLASRRMTSHDRKSSANDSAFATDDRRKWRRFALRAPLPVTPRNR